jgi:hypothetical protein
MMRKLSLAVMLGVAVMLAGPAGLGLAPAAAQGCLSAGDARAAVQSGDVVPLSRVLGQIRAAGGGEVLPTPQLCNIGGRLVYMVNVLTRTGAIKRLVVDARSGNISGY